MDLRFAAPASPKQPADGTFFGRFVSPLPAWVLALGAAAVVLFAATGLDYLLKGHTKSFLSTIDASSVMAAVVSGLLFYRMLCYEHQRRKAIRQRLEIIGEMNHHVRNAIHTITLSAHFPHDENAVKAIDESVQRVDWALKEILPKL